MTTPDQVLAEAARHIGYREAPDGWTKFGDSFDDPYGNWCMWFVRYSFSVAGGGALVPATGNTVAAARWFQGRGQLHHSRPLRGDVGFADWSGQRRIAGIDHGFLVDQVHGDGTVVTIEGNTSNQVARRWRNPKYLVAYGRPAYPAQPRRTVRRGDRGDTVRLLQRLLGGLTVDGRFGPATEAAVRQHQRLHGLTADGVAGPATWATLTPLTAGDTP